MDDVLRRIIEIEDKAQNVVEDIKKESADFDADIERVIAEIQRNIDTKVNEKITYIKEVETEVVEREVTSYQSNLTESMDKLNKTYEENKEQWVLEAYNMILKRRYGNA